MLVSTVSTATPCQWAVTVIRSSEVAAKSYTERLMSSLTGNGRSKIKDALPAHNKTLVGHRWCRYRKKFHKVASCN